MRKPSLYFLIDAIAFVAFVLLAGTGVLMRYVLPPGSGHFLTLWGLDRHAWGVFHFWIAVALMAALALHLLLHWRWVVGMIRGRPREGSGVRVALAIVGILGLIGLALSPFFGPVEQGGEPPHKMRSGEVPESPDSQINGAMTLREVEQLTGVPPEVILRELGLPPGVPVDERLGRLRRQYGFNMDDLREIVRKQAGNK
jgi:Domain of unknown function (DUF4405)